MKNSIKSYTRTLSITLCSLGFAVTNVKAAVLTGPIVNPANDHSYFLLSYDTWTASEAEAESLGGHLATVNNAAENQWISDTFFPLAPEGKNQSLWIGLYDPTQDASGGSHAANFVWADGDTASYRNWFTGEPNNTGGVEYYATIRGPINPLPYTWNDLDNNGGGEAGTVFGVVEVVPEPSTIAFAGLAILGALSFRKKKCT